MKRVLLFVLALIMVFSMVACGEKSKTYKGEGNYEDATLTISGKKATVATKITMDEDEMEMDCKLTIKISMSGTIEDEDDDEIEVEIKSAAISIKVTGDEKDDFKEGLLELAEESDDKDVKKMYKNLANGKTVTIKESDDLWDLIGIEDSVTLALDKEDGTFDEA